MLKYKFQLQDRPLGAFAGPSILTTGGKAMVCVAGTPGKATLYDSAGASLANPISLTRGSGEFYTANTVTAVDLFIMTGDGQFVTLWSVGPDELNEVPVDRDNRHQMLVLPFSIADQVSDATAIASGFTLMVGMVFLPWPHVKITTIDAAITVDVGITGDENGFISAADTATLGLVKDVDGTLIASIVTYIATAVALKYTFLTAADTAKGYAFLPYMLMTTGSPTITP
jgi:hypothetical protein